MAAAAREEEVEPEDEDMEEEDDGVEEDEASSAGRRAMDPLSVPVTAKVRFRISDRCLVNYGPLLILMQSILATWPFTLLKAPGLDVVRDLYLCELTRVGTHRDVMARLVGYRLMVREIRIVDGTTSYIFGTAATLGGDKLDGPHYS
jgi:hypothetical protein